MTNSRAIKLSRIHALNWYGYQDTLPVDGNLVLAGVTGSGKSILMDLIMLVLVGPEKARQHFNRSATGSRSDRTLKGYCLLDTKREENGQPQYYHDRGVITYIALEFAWPDSDRLETWGLRIEFRNSSENDGIIKPFFCKGKLEYEDFLAISLEDGKRRPLDLRAFTELINLNEGRIFPTTREYTRDMANPSHLNFNRDVLDRLLPSAMSFTNLKSFDDFCRQYVLPTEPVPVEEVTASYRDFLSYNKDLTDLRIQLGMLQQIDQLGKQLRKAESDRDVARFLGAEAALQHAEQLVTNARTRLAELEEKESLNASRLKELESQIDHARHERERLIGMVNDQGGTTYLMLNKQKAQLEGDVSSLRSLLQRVEDRLRHRVETASKWLADAKKIAAHKSVDTSAVQHFIQVLDGCEMQNSYTVLSQLRDAATDLGQKLRASIQDETRELQQHRKREDELEQEIAALKRGASPIPQPLLHALNERLPSLPGQTAARTLRELCEVTDETWREAAEVVFTDKFAVVVDEDQYTDAVRIYHELKASSQSRHAAPESLIHPARALELKATVLPGSLAEKLETSHPVVRAMLDNLFGRLICFNRLDEALAHDGDAILPDGLAIQSAQVKRASYYDGIPFIGKRGLKRQLEIKLNNLNDVKAHIRALEPIEQAVDSIARDMNQQIPDHSSMGQELGKLHSLAEKENDLSKVLEELSAIDTAQFDALKQQADEWELRRSTWDKERFDLATQSQHKEIHGLRQTLETRQKDVDERSRTYTSLNIQLGATLNMQRTREWRDDYKQQFNGIKDVMAREFEKARGENENLAVRKEADLKISMNQFKQAFTPRFDDFPEDGRSTKRYEETLARIDGASIPEYEKKAEQEKRRWEHLFRTQVLTRMHAALKNVENTIALLNQQLKRPIGRDKYRIERQANPDFRFYQELINMNSMYQENELFFASVSNELKETLEHFLKTLVEKANSPEAARLLDYRQYYDYKLMSSDVHDLEAKPIDVDKQSGKMSGGENQSPYFVAILASYLHAYNRHEKRWKEPSLSIVPIDEAFSKLSGERIQDCIAAVQELDLQGVFSMSSGNIPYAFSLCDELIVITKREERRANKIRIRNIPSVLHRDTPEGAEWMNKNGA